MLSSFRQIGETSLTAFRTAFAMVMSVTILGGSPALAGEPWYSVYRSDHREWTLALTGGFALLDLDGEATIDESLGDSDISLDGTLDLEEFGAWVRRSWWTVSPTTWAIWSTAS